MFIINQSHHGEDLAIIDFSELTPVVPSTNVPNIKKKEIHELTDEEIKKIINKFVFARE